ncbi:hypothetical protein ACOME3_003567 [Neoechinorhynchus agilis]
MIANGVKSADQFPAPPLPSQEAASEQQPKLKHAPRAPLDAQNAKIKDENKVPKTQQSSFDKPIVFKSPESYVGFATFPNQLHRRAVRRGFCFNLMVVGESGLGKSTFLNSLFMTELSDVEPKMNRINVESAKVTTQIKTRSIRLTENGVGLNLTLIDTPGFGDSLDNSGCWEPIVQHVNNGFAEYLNAEFNIDRKLPIDDHRVHCCLYFIAPTGHCLRSIDIELMTRLSDRVNIVPLIAKSDTLTNQELKAFKKQIMSDLNKHRIKIYDFGLSATTAPAEEFDGIDPKTLIPFAVIGSNCVRKDEESGRIYRGREYAWGFVNADNTEHCDFLPLRKMLIRTHMYDLRESTHCIHYESYRSQKLTEITSFEANGAGKQRTLLSQIEDEKREFEQRLYHTRVDMEQVYENKVAEKMQKLEETRLNVLRTRENYQANIKEDRDKLEVRKAQLEQEKREQSVKQTANTPLSTTNSTPKYKRNLFN